MSTEKPSRKQKGLCSSCNNQRREGKTLCQSCADHRKDRLRKRRAAGYCIKTGCNNKVVNGASRCPRCAGKRTRYKKGIESGQRAKVVKRHGGLCECCGRKAFIVHYINSEDDDDLDNLTLLCKRCNVDINRFGNLGTRHRAIRLLRDWDYSSPEKRKRPQTIAWSRLRRSIIDRDGAACVLCLSTNRLTVHHRDSRGLRDQIPNNNPINLVCLCKVCHTAITSLKRDADLNVATSFIASLGPGTAGTPVS